MSLQDTVRHFGLLSRDGWCSPIPRDPAWPAPSDIEEIEIAMQFFGHCGKTSRVNKHHTSYGLKHVAEKWAKTQGARGYISNGALIAAALLLDYTYQQVPGTQHVYLNIPSRAVSRLRT